MSLIRDIASEPNKEQGLAGQAAVIVSTHSDTRTPDITQLYQTSDDFLSVVFVNVPA